LRFTVRRPPTGEVSPCSHRPSGGDVACSVDVGVAPASRASFALEHRLALAVSGRDVPTHRTSLRRVRGRNLLDPTMGLVLQTRGEQPPTTTTDGPVQSTLLSDPHTGPLDRSPRRAGHRPHVEGFDPDHIEAARNVDGGLFDPVLAPVHLTRLELRDRQSRSGAPGRAQRGAGKPLLQHLQPLGLAPAQPRGVKEFTGRQRRRYGHAAVDTHHAAVTRTTDRVRDVDECDMPAASPIPGDPVGLDTGGHWARQPKPNPAHLGHPYPKQPISRHPRKITATTDTKGEVALPPPAQASGFRATTIR